MVLDWFRKFEEALKEHQISMENIYNMDETNKKDIYITNISFAIRTNQTSYVVVDS